MMWRREKREYNFDSVFTPTATQNQVLCAYLAAVLAALCCADWLLHKAALVAWVQGCPLLSPGTKPVIWPIAAIACSAQAQLTLGLTRPSPAVCSIFPVSQTWPAAALLLRSTACLCLHRSGAQGTALTHSSA